MKEMLCGDIKKHVDLQCSDVKKYDDLPAIIMKWAIAKRIEKETRNGDVGAVDGHADGDQTSGGLDEYQDRLEKRRAALQIFDAYQRPRRVLHWNPSGYNRRGHPVKRWIGLFEDPS